MKIEGSRVPDGAQGMRRVITRRNFLKIGGASVAGATLLGTAGCGVFDSGGSGGGEGGGGGGGGDIVTVNLQDSIRGLDSAANATDEVSFNVLVNCIEGLQRLDPDDQPIPGQAEKVDVSEDGLTYTFTLRDGINWSNGDPVTAADFEFAWLKAMDPDTGGQYAYIITQFIEGGDEFNTGPTSDDNQEEHDSLRDAVGVTATDDKTLEVKLTAPAPFWLGLTAFPVYYPQNQAYVEEQGEGYAQDADSVLFNGPYTLTEYNPTQGVTFVKSDDYWDAENVSIPRVEGKIVKEVETAVNLHESGELDITEITQEFVDEYKDSPDFNQRSEFATFYLVFNEKIEIFQNANVRKAFQIGFDRKAHAEQILNDGSVQATGLVPPGMSGPEGQTFREAAGATVPEFDPEEARRLYEQGIQEVGGEAPTIELLSYETSTARDTATFLQSQFEENLGAKIDVTIQPFDRKLELEADGDFQFSFQGWGADYNDPMTYLDLWLSDSSFNTGGYSNERFDELINQAKEETDPAARMEQMIEAETLLLTEDAGLCPIHFEGTTRLIDPSIKGFVYHNLGGALDFKLYSVEG
jgi:oligopeptide transport system substrate-binding protein